MGAEISIPTLRIIDRGDPAAFDFGVGDFTADGTWRDLDLSAIVPAAAKGVHISINVKDNVIDSEIKFRTKGHVNDFNSLRIITQVANQAVCASGLIMFGQYPQVIQYNADNLVWLTINIAINFWLI